MVMHDSTDGSRQRSATRSLPQYAREIEDEISALAATLEAASDAAQRTIAEQLDQRPYTTLAIAAGAGYVLGGGLAARTTRILLGVGARVAIAYAAQGLSALLAQPLPAEAGKRGRSG